MAAGKLNFLLIICCMFGVAMVDGNCPNNFVHIGESCYHFSEATGNYFEGISYCANLRTQLVSIQTESESNLINDYLKTQLTGTAAKDFWTSGKDLTRQNQYYWLGTGQAFGKTNWCENEPNSPPDRETCVHIYEFSGKLCWADFNCAQGHGASPRFLCESKLGRVQTQSECDAGGCSKCPENFERIDEGCYHFSAASGTFMKSIKYCAKLDAYPISPDTAAKSSRISLQIYHKHKFVRTGYWTSGKEVLFANSAIWFGTGKNTTFKNWCKGEPSSMGKIGYCVYIMNFDGGNICWDDHLCDKSDGNKARLHFLCEYIPIPIKN